MAWLRNRGFQSSHVIPDGQTITPTDDVQILLNCANIWDKTYTTISQLLADTTTLQAVINSNNAIDYLVRSKTFASGSVPIMTSNTAPSGTCIQNGAESGYYAYSAFDRKDDTLFATKAAIANAYVGYTFPSAKRIVKCKAQVGTNTTAESHYTYKIQGTNDGTNWTDLADAISVTVSDHGYTWINIDLDATNTYTSFRLIHPSTLETSRRMQVRTLQFYEADAVFTEDSTAMSYIGANDYASNTLLGEDNPSLIPTMTSNTAPSGTVSASAEYSTDYKAFKAFDNDDGTRWASTGSTNQYIQYEFANSQEVKKILIRPYFATNSSAKNITIKCSNNGTDWNSLGSYTLENTDGIKTCVLQNTQSATFWRIDIEDSYNNRTIAISTIRFYAKEYDSEVWLNAICNSTYWNSVLNAGIPTMTSDTTPSGVCSANNLYSGYYAYKAFDKDINSRTYGNSAGTGGGYYVQYQFPSSFHAYKAYIAVGSNNSTRYNLVVKIQGSNDGSVWEDLTTNQTLSVVSGSTTTSYCIINGDYTYFRLYKVSSSGSIRYCVNEFDVYGRENGGVQTWLRAGGITNKSYTTLTEVLNDTATLSVLMASADAVDYLVTCKGWAETICADSSAMSYIGLNNYASNTLLADETWLNAICNSTYFESVLNKKIPTMTSDTEPSGTCFGSSYFNSGHPYYYAFDGSTSTSWLPKATSSSTGQYIGYTFPSNVKAYMYTLDYTEYTNTSKIVIQGSNGTWSNLTSTLTLAGQSSLATLSLKNRFEQNVDEYTSYRIYISQGTSVDGYAKCFCALRFNVYGREDV